METYVEFYLDNGRGLLDPVRRVVARADPRAVKDIPERCVRFAFVECRGGVQRYTQEWWYPHGELVLLEDMEALGGEGALDEDYGRALHYAHRYGMPKVIITRLPGGPVQIHGWKEGRDNVLP